MDTHQNSLRFFKEMGYCLSLYNELQAFLLGALKTKIEFLKVVALKARASYREHLSPLSRKKDVGFRCAKDRPPFMERIFGFKSDPPKDSVV